MRDKIYSCWGSCFHIGSAQNYAETSVTETVANCKRQFLGQRAREINAKGAKFRSGLVGVRDDSGVNGCRLDGAEDELLSMFFGVASGRVSETELGEWVRGLLG